MTCDVLLVIGTSAVVYPAAGLIGLARQAGAKIILINTQRSLASPMADVELIGRAGAVVPRLLLNQPGRYTGANGQQDHDEETQDEDRAGLDGRDDRAC
jgi:NAD-dependent SIR2 family protein deacetylase